MLCACCANLNAQNLTEGEIELENEAVSLFKNKQFYEALPKFSQLLSLHPKNPDYNFGYAVCLIETNTNTTKAIDYLNFASSKSNNPVIYFYLGRAYHLNYKFDEALINFGSFKNKAAPYELKEYDVNKYIDMCKNGKELVRYISDLIVLDNKKIKRDKFYYSYELSDFGGKLIIKPPEFKSKLDDKHNVSPLMFLSDSGQVYFANYVKKNGIDLFRAVKQDDGTWSKPENLGQIINTKYDEDYPFIHPDGKTLYFSSKGHNSMGGYDIFRSIYDSTLQQWGKPENLDFPTNSPYDDFLFISDNNEDYAYFASNRETNQDKISVYKIEIDKNPVEKELYDIEEVVRKSKLEITPLAEIQNKHNAENNANTENQYNKNTSNRKELAYNFDNLKYSNNLTIDDILNEAKKDVEKIKEDIQKTETEAEIAFIVADEKNKLADKKRAEADKIKATNPEKANEINSEADLLDKEAVIAFNLAKNLQKSAQEKYNDLDDAKQLVENVRNTTSNIEQLTEELNDNRQYLSKGYSKYTNTNTVVTDKQQLADKKNKELKQVRNQLYATQNDIVDLKNQIDETEKKLKHTKDETEKSILKEDLKEYKNDLMQLEATEVAEKNKVEKLTIEQENIRKEIEILKSLNNTIAENNHTQEEIARKAGKLDKTKLENDIFDKEFIADKNLAEEIKTTTGNTETKSSTITVDTANNTGNNTVDNTVKTQQQDKDIADSLRYIIQTQKNKLSETTDEEEKERLQKEISELEELVALKEENINNQTSATNKTQEEDYSYKDFQEDMHDNNPALTFNTTDKYDSKTKQYEKEKFNAIYYSNLQKEQEKKLSIIKNNLNKTDDETVKEKLKNDIRELETLIAYSRKAAEESEKLAETLKKEIPDNISDNEMTSEALLVKATEYKPENKIKYSKVEEETLDFTVQDRQFADKALSKWIKKQENIRNLKEKLSETQNPGERKKIEKEIEKEKDNAKTEFLTFDKAYKEANKEEYAIYKKTLDDYRIINKSENSKNAGNLEKDADIFFEKAALIRENANIIEDDSLKAAELIKAKNYELVAIQYQKHALDLYYDEIKAQETNIIADNTKSETKTEARAITLLSEEEQQLKQYKKENHLAKTLETKAENTLKEISEKRKIADNTFSKKEKAKILKGLDEKEKQAKQNLEKAHISYGISDSIRYNLYKNKLEELTETLPEVGNNNKIAKQYINEADFYFSHAAELREQAKNTDNQDQRIKIYEKALKFEEQAMANQEIAIDIVMEIDPVEFASMNNLVKIDRLEAINKPVNIDNVVKVETKQIIEKLNLPEEDLQALDEATKIKNTVVRLLADADSLEKKINELKEINANTSNQKTKKKNEKEIKKLEEKMFASRFGASELSESVNNTIYWIYRDNFKNNRIRGNSEEARQGRQLEKNANVNFNKAKSLRDKSFLTEKADLAYKFLTQAEEFEKKAIEEQETAYGIYLNIEPVEKQMVADDGKNELENNLIVVKSTADITEIDSTEYFAENKSDNTETADNNTGTETDDKNTTGNDTRTSGDEQGNTESADNNTGTETDDKNTTGNDTRTSGDEQGNTETADNNTGTETDDKNTTGNDTRTSVDEQGNTETVDNTTGTEITDRNTSENTANLNDVALFSIEPVSRYSESNPIPINESLPQGIVFKVQIGAFKRAIPQDAFKGLNPVSGEKIEGSSFTRYLAGLFKSYEGARTARTDIVKMGYKDAFIVAYNNGKRIPLYMARNMIKSGKYMKSDDYEAIAQAEVESVSNRTVLSNNKTTKQEAGTKPKINNAVKGTDLEKVEGLLYTVQIGVYKQAVPHSKLFNIKPIYEEKTEYGFIRYTTGIFNDFVTASNEKDRIVKLGITDAFVTAYFNGKRITLREAKNIATSNDAEVFAVVDPVKLSEIEPDNNIDLGDLENINIHFKVQIGAYKERVPNNVVSDFIRIAANNKLDQTKDENGVTIYTVGDFNSYEQANQTKTILINEGLKDAFVIAFNGAKKIPVKDALRLLQ